MSNVVFALCALTAGTCAVLLLRGYLKARTGLLFWSTICFCCLALANILVYVDLVMFPTTGYSLVRIVVTFVAVSVLVFGMVKETV